LPRGAKRDATIAAAALAPALPGILASGEVGTQAAAVTAIERLGIKDASPSLAALVARPGGPRRAGAVRAQALRVLAALAPAEADRVLPAASKDDSPDVRMAALDLNLARRPTEARALVTAAMAAGTWRERQAVVGLLPQVPAHEAQGLLSAWLDDLVAGRLGPELTLDLVEQAERLGVPSLVSRARALTAGDATDELGPHKLALTGGRWLEGEQVFFRKPETSCLRCHKVNGEGGEAGPDLTGIGKKRDRRYLLEAVVFPNKAFAPGFESVILTLKDGNITGGILRREDPRHVEVVTPEGEVQRIPRDHIGKREAGSSGMPDGFGDILKPRELRDLVEFLSAL
jgi:quinoprotein glucose dehydrogenase